MCVTLFLATASGLIQNTIPYLVIQDMNYGDDGISCRNLFRAFIAILAFLFLFTDGVSSQADSVVFRPNILLIMADDLGYETLGYSGGTSYNTPNLDELAKTGTWFKNFHTAPMCSPSRVSILTGRYPFRVTTKWAHLPDKEITFAEVIKSTGYKTAMAGKWQFGQPNRLEEKGFEQSAAWAYNEGPRYWQPLIYQNGKILESAKEKYGPDVFTDFLIEFMAENKDTPFLAYYPMSLAHSPKKWEPKGPHGEWETYKEMVETIDKLVGKLVATIDTLGIREKTLILFTADNGSPKRVVSYIGATPVPGGKGTLKDTGTHVPLIANWLGTTPSGTINSDLLDVTDVMPTLVNLAGADLPDVTIDGKGFSSQLRGEQGNPRDWIYSEWKGNAWVRNNRWKLYRDGRLFDMINDPLETSPLSRKSAIAKEAKQQLQPVLDSQRQENY